MNNRYADNVIVYKRKESALLRISKNVVKRARGVL